MSDVAALQQERNELFRAVHNSKIPKRVPISISIPFEAVAQFGGLDLVQAQWQPEIVAEAADRLCELIFSDTCPFFGSMRFPSFYQILDSQSFVMGSNGFIQHPEVTGMLPEDYDYLIEKPYDCLLERVIPRQYKALDLKDPVKMALTLTKSYLAYREDMGAAAPIIGMLTEKYGYSTIGGSFGGFTSAPFDFLADQLRGFKGISMDIRRMPEKVAAACEALYPIVFKQGLPANPSIYAPVMFPLHMPTFMREKDFARLWWPTFKRLVDEYASLGVRTQIFCEDDWTRYLDYLYELPTNTVMIFEYGDLRQIKDKLGKKHIITGLYPMTMLARESKEKCLDKAKEIIDVLAPGGKYIFQFDKQPLNAQDINIENYRAVVEYVRDNAVYSNPGEVHGLEFNPADYKAEPRRSFESKYFTVWEEFKARNPAVSEHGKEKLQNLEEILFQYLMYLLI
jgi:hypothetical protein